jgi:tetratricopeptide (TPR) repeat protein
MSARKARPAGGNKRSDRTSGLPRPGLAGAAGFSRIWLLLPALLLATFAAYYPAWRGTLLWDDDFHITRPELRSLAGLQRIWLSVGATPQYYPVVHTVFWLQYKLWGDNPLGYHLVNIALHAVSAFLLALILRRLKARGAVLAAVIFALHPVQVESVAWMTELKNILSGVFYLASALAYLDFDKTRKPPRYVLALVLFVLALLSKTVTATLPAALLVVFWWQRGRIDWRKDVVPLLPFFAIGMVGGATTAWLERTLVGAQGTAFELTFVERCLIAGRVIWFYLAKLAWPANLIFIYPRWEVSQRVWWQYLYLLSAAALVGGLWVWRNRSRAPLAAVLFFAGTLFPALGFLNVYPFRFSFVADHFQYLASIGIIALFAAGLTSLAEQWRLDRHAARATAIAVAGVLAVLTWNQSGLYADAETLYRSTIERNPSCWMARNNLGELLQGSPGGLTEAMAQFREALRLYPTYAEAHNNLGAGLLGAGRVDEAIAEFKEAITDKPAYAGAHDNLGVGLLRTGRADEAIAEFKEAVTDNPADVSARANLALALAQRGRLDEAAEQYQETLRERPDSATAHANLGVVLAQMGRLQDSLPHFREAIRLQPNGASGYYYALASALQGLDQTDAAIAAYREALTHGPGGDEASIHNDLGISLSKLGRNDQAVTEFREAVRLNPGLADARANLARAMTATGAGTTK